MKNHDILFDKDKQQIAFVRANCQALNEPFVFSPDSYSDTPTPNSAPKNGTEPIVEPKPQEGSGSQANKDDRPVGTGTNLYTENQKEFTSIESIYVNILTSTDLVKYLLIVFGLIISVVGIVVFYRYTKKRKYNNM